MNTTYTLGNSPPRTNFNLHFAHLALSLVCFKEAPRTNFNLLRSLKIGGGSEMRK